MKCFQTNSGSLFRLFRVRHVRSSWGECSPSLSVQTILPSTIPWQLTMRPNVRGLQTFWWDSLDDICPRTILEGSFFLFLRIKNEYLQRERISNRESSAKESESNRGDRHCVFTFHLKLLSRKWDGKTPGASWETSLLITARHTHTRACTHTRKRLRECAVLLGDSDQRAVGVT